MMDYVHTEIKDTTAIREDENRFVSLERWRAGATQTFTVNAKSLTDL